MFPVKRLLAGLLALLVAFQPLRADDLPELGDVASGDLPMATEKKVGQRIMHEIRWREPSYLDDPDIEAYLNQIGGLLAAASSDPGLGFYFFPINDRSINAFAMPGGYIGVHTGLIHTAESESELAGVLGHEIAHVTQRHIARQVFQSKKLGMASMLAMGLALLAARSNSQVAGAAMATSQAGAMSAQLAFSRDFERESDRMGFEILRKAGMDVRGMSTFFSRLQRATRTVENTATAYLRTHPLTSERITDMQNREQEIGYRQVPDSLDFQLVKAKIRAMQGTPAEAVAAAEALVLERKFTAELPARYGLAYAHFRARHYDLAEKQLLAVRQGSVSAAMFERLLAESRLAAGKTDEGLKDYRNAMVRYPLNLGLRYGYSRALIDARHFDEALRYLNGQLADHPEEVRLHKLVAEAHAGLGQVAEQHRALAESFALQGQTAGAIQQLELAQKAGDADFFTQSVIDTRLRELKLRLIDELKERRN